MKTHFGWLTHLDSRGSKCRRLSEHNRLNELPSVAPPGPQPIDQCSPTAQDGGVGVFLANRAGPGREGVLSDSD